MLDQITYQKQGSDITHPDANRIVTCRVCALYNVEKLIEARKLNAHLGGKHTKKSGDFWDKKRYIAKWGDADFWEYVPPKEQLAVKRIQMQEINQKSQAERKKADTMLSAQDCLVDENRNQLTSEERAFYEKFCEDTFQQVDRDEAQLSAISALAFDLIVSTRLRSQLLKGTGAKARPEWVVAMGDLEKTLKTVEDRITKTADKLGISREAQQKRGAQTKSTPSMIISAYMDEIARCSPESLDALKLEETKVWKKMQARIEEHILSVAPDVEREDEVSDGDTKSAPLTLRQALDRAGIVSGGLILPSSTQISEDSDSELPF
jgi:hypothetical protein